MLAARAEWRQTARAWATFLAAAALASLATPHGIEAWLFPFHLMSLSFALDFVQEWHAPPASQLVLLGLWSAGLVVLLVVRRARVPLLRLAVVAGMVWMAAGHARNAELVALIAPLLVAPFLGSGEAEKIALRHGGRYIAAAFAFMVLTTCLAAETGYAGENPSIAPKAALQAAARARLAGPVFNDYDFGGYLIFTGMPVFVDGRIDLYGDAFMRDYAAARNGDARTLAALLDRYRVGWTLLSPAAPANKALDAMPGWRRVYAGADAVIYARER
jgi:hypothetical protein